MTAQPFNYNYNQVNVISILNRKMETEKLLQYRTKSFQRNEYIYLPNKNADQVFVIKEGRVKIGSHHDGKEVIKKIAIKGEIFGELSLLGQAHRKDYAITMEDTEVYILSNQELQTLMEEYQNFSNYMSRS